MISDRDLPTCYDHLVPTDFPSMTLDEATRHIRVLRASTRLVGVEGQYRLDLAGSGRPVCLIKMYWNEHFDEVGNMTHRSSTDLWICQDVLTGEECKVEWLRWGPILTEMEVLAWVAEEPKDES
jgi:hypothetical protein